MLKQKSADKQRDEASNKQQEEEMLKQKSADKQRDEASNKQQEEEMLKPNKSEAEKPDEEARLMQQAEETRKQEEPEAEQQLEETSNKHQEEEMQKQQKCLADKQREKKRFKQPEQSMPNPHQNARNKEEEDEILRQSAPGADTVHKDTTEKYPNVDRKGRPPTALYGKMDKAIRQRTFPCPACAQPVDGSHQCDVCFAHVHVFCGTPHDNSPEGYGQVMVCQQCGPHASVDGATQPYGRDGNSTTPPYDGDDGGVDRESESTTPPHDGGVGSGVPATADAERVALAQYLTSAMKTNSLESSNVSTAVDRFKSDRALVNKLQALQKN
jgi:hypothetical protein